MLNQKNIAIIFAVGFLLSVFAGTLGRVGLGVIFVRALLSGGIFVGLAVGANFVYKKFLADTDSLEEKTVEENQSEKTSHSIDITIDDELPDSASAPAFDLSKNFSSAPPRDDVPLREVPLESAREHAPVEGLEEAASFKQSSLDSITASAASVSTPSEDSRNVQVAKEHPIQVESADQVNSLSNVSEASVGSADNELGMLPDIEALDIEGSSSSSDDDSDVIQDSVFAETGSVRPSAQPVVESELGDAREIAAAIRTALTQDA